MWSPPSKNSWRSEEDGEVSSYVQSGAVGTEQKCTYHAMEPQGSGV